MREVESESLSSDIGSCLVDMSTENLAESLEHEVTRRVKCCSLDSIIGKSSLELACCSGTRKLLMFLKSERESFHIYSKSCFFRELSCHLYRESVGVEECECLRS